MVNSNSISFENAIELCKKHRLEHKVRLLSQCWVCLRYSKEDPVWMCFHNSVENRGCDFINKLFDEKE